MRRVGVAVAGLVALLLAFGNVPARAGDLDGFGIVLMHGKQGIPGGPIAGLAQALTAEGARVVMPEMPWSRRRIYDATYESALDEIGRAIDQLRGRGAKRIVVAGQSLGANAALGYAARRGGVAAVVMLAPGHTPEAGRFAERAGPGLARLKELVATGRGDVQGSYPDFNQGRTFELRATPRVYLSYFDPEGPAVMPLSAAKLGDVPLLWVIGRDDPLFARGKAYAYDRAAKNSKSRYIEVGGGHRDTPDVARAQIIAWLKTL